jgi:hypothetical protein
MIRPAGHSDFNKRIRYRADRYGTELADLAKRTPGLFFQSHQFPTDSNPIIRGVGSPAAPERQR